jgi:hypothetical protein
MKSVLIKTIGVCLLVALSSVVMLSVSSGHWWKKVRTAHLTYEGQDLPDGAVYQSPDGQLLINLQERVDEGSLFVIYPVENKIGLPNKRHFFFLPGYAFSRYAPPLVLFADDPVKSGRDPELVISEHSIEFLTLSRRKVQISFD